ncbi:DUF1428 domain-containing protein [Maliponia aquimaris]|uniref:RNA signal recognition particle n=1 Tax=Maliponia aquimaris TaxID=1673631 RepID=A0A238KQD4_9RHOB|nr:DUF1428 domain-containing protein [Maliponia aquimaris]SMX44877.1 hypothetical protein MAA8898_03082 [Maliponia aquimaris]
MPYFDFFLAPVADARRADYETFVATMQDQFIGYGATEVVDCWGDDVPEGKLTSLPLAVKLAEGETVAAGYVVWPSKAARDAGWAKMMSEENPGDMPFDGKRMIFGGFSEIKRTSA